MKKYIWNKFLTILNSVSPEIRKQLISFSYLAKYYGQYNSIKKNESVDANNNPLPWITYPAIEYLGNLDFSKEKIFEVDFSKVKKLKDVIAIIKAFGYKVSWKLDAEVPKQFKEVYDKGFLKRIQ